MTLKFLPFVLFIFPCAVSFAHRFPFPRQAFLSIALEEVKITVSYIVAPGDEAKMLREHFDLNWDGSVQGQEQEELEHYLTGRAVAGLSLSLNNEPKRMHRSVVEAGNTGDGTDSPRELSITVDLLLKSPPWRPGENEIVVKNESPGPSLPLTVQITPGVTMTKREPYIPGPLDLLPGKSIRLGIKISRS